MLKTLYSRRCNIQVLQFLVMNLQSPRLRKKNLHININDINLSTTAFFVTVICKLNQMCIYNKRANLLDSAHLGKKIFNNFLNIQH